MTLGPVFTVFVVLVLITGSAPTIAHAQGRVIQAQDGDLVMMPAAGTITVARPLTGHMKLIPHEQGRLLVVLLDEGPQVDGVVDLVYRFNVIQQPVPAEYAMEGPGTFEEYEQVGARRGVRSYGLVLPQGRILLRQHGPFPPDLAWPEHIAALQFSGHGFSRVRATYEEAERSALAQGSTGQVGHETAIVGTSAAPSRPVDGPVRVGGTIREPRKIKDVPPVMPEAARRAGVIGIVIVEATIDAQGRVSNARILRSIPLLDQAALEAVRQWEYEPVLVNGVPQRVVMTVTVPFTGHP
jgi:TonB family protein